jgi:hypothetical protein
MFFKNLAFSKFRSLYLEKQHAALQNFPKTYESLKALCQPKEKARRYLRAFR